MSSSQRPSDLQTEAGEVWVIWKTGLGKPSRLAWLPLCSILRGLAGASAPPTLHGYQIDVSTLTVLLDPCMSPDKQNNLLGPAVHIYGMDMTVPILPVLLVNY